MRSRFKERYAFPSVKSAQVVFDPVKDKSMTQQQFAKDADINTILAKVERTGLVPLRGGQPYYGDFTKVSNFHTMQATVAAVMQDFMGLPADLRQRFQNDPATLLEWIADPKNLVEAVKLGLRPKEDLPPPPPPQEKPEPVKP